MQTNNDILEAWISHAATIEVDGIQRPTANSLGQPIHATEEGVHSFWRWYADSKFVDEAGRPLVVYHGGSFDPKSGAKPNTHQQGMFFTTSRKLAESYASKTRGKDGFLAEAYLKSENPFDKDSDAHTRAPWLREWISFWRQEDGWVDRATGEEMTDSDVIQMIQTGMIYDYSGIGSRQRWNDFLATARERHDGYFGEDPTECVRGEVETPVIYVAFSPEQIRMVCDVVDEPAPVLEVAASP
jgi:hypothetical protein